MLPWTCLLVRAACQMPRRQLLRKAQQYSGARIAILIGTQGLLVRFGRQTCSFARFISMPVLCRSCLYCANKTADSPNATKAGPRLCHEHAGGTMQARCRRLSRPASRRQPPTPGRLTQQHHQSQPWHPPWPRFVSPLPPPSGSPCWPAQCKAVASPKASFPFRRSPLHGHPAP